MYRAVEMVAVTEDRQEVDMEDQPHQVKEATEVGAEIHHDRGRAGKENVIRPRVYLGAVMGVVTTAMMVEETVMAVMEVMEEMDLMQAEMMDLEHSRGRYWLISVLNMNGHKHC